MRSLLGLDRPISTQFWHYLTRLLHGDLGVSLWSKRPVLKEILLRFPITLELAFLSVFFTYIIGLPVGVISAVKQNTPMDYILRSCSIGFLSIPGFWIATLILVFGSIWFKWVPPMRYIPFHQDPWSNLSQLFLPAFILSLALSAGIMRMTRTMMLEVLREDYIRTARAKGLTVWVTIFRHALKNAVIPVISISGIQLAILVGGTVVMESVFVLPGIGKYLLESIIWRDYPVIQGINLFIGAAIILINLGTDLLYGFLDPRIRYR